MPDQSDEFERLTPADAGTAAARADARAPRMAERIDDQRVELHPRGVGGVLDLGLDLIRNRFAACVVIATLIWLPMRLVATWLYPDPAGLADQDQTAMLEFWGKLLFGSGTNWLAQVFVAAFTARILFGTITGGDATIASAVRRTVASLPALLVLGIVSVLLMFAGALACCLPMFTLLWLVTPLPYVYMLEDVDIGTALRRSFGLSCGKLFSWPSFYAFWRWAGILVTTSLLVLPLSSLAEAGERPDVRQWLLGVVPVSALTLDALSVGVGALCLGIATAIQAAVFTAYYLDCRVRRDGLDLRTWLERVRAADRPVVPGGSAVP